MIKSYGRLDRVPVGVNRDQDNDGFPGGAERAAASSEVIYDGGLPAFIAPTGVSSGSVPSPIQGDDEKVSGERGTAKGAEEAGPDDLVELLMGAYGKADKFNAEHIAPHPANLREINRQRG